MQSRNRETALPGHHQTKKTVTYAHNKHKHKHSKEIEGREHKTERQMGTAVTRKKQHLVSKSQLQTKESKLYNSPNADLFLGHPQPSVAPFTFTRLLQEQSEKQPNTLSSDSAVRLLPHDLLLSPQEASHPHHQPVNQVATSASVASGRPFMIPCDAPIRRTGEVFERRQLQAREDTRKSHQLRSNKSISKSPVRFANTHKLNHTPKLKQKLKGPQKQNVKMNKTFASVLAPNTEIKTAHPKEDSINLLCYEQMCRKEAKESETKARQTLKSKSNLQSTGIISLSQPLGNSQAHNRYCKPTNLTSTLNRTDLIKAFSSNDSQLSSEDNQVFTAALQSLREQAFKGRNALMKVNSEQAHQDFAAHIECCSNPEIEVDDSVAALKQIAERVQKAFSTIISQLQTASKNFAEAVVRQVTILEQSKQSNIDWAHLQAQIGQKQRIQTLFVQHQIFQLKLNSLQSITHPNIPELQQLQTLKSDIQTYNDQVQSLIESKKSTSANALFGDQVLQMFQGEAHKVQRLLQQLSQKFVFDF